jgi:hypothetical protein
MDVTVTGDILHLLHIFTHLEPATAAGLLLKSNMLSKPLVDEPGLYLACKLHRLLLLTHFCCLCQTVQ